MTQENPPTRPAHPHVNWAKVFFYLDCALLVWAGLWLLSGNWLSVIDPKAIVKFLQGKTPFSFLAPAFQTRLWQPVAAIMAVSALAKPLGKLFDCLTAGIKPPEFLNAICEENADRFIKRKITLVGRDRELQLLREFVGDRRTFAWCWLTGRGIQGKTRIAVEACLHLARGDWGRQWRRSHVGILGAGQSAEFWKTWQPERRTLIVVDDAASRTSDAELLLTSLAQRPHNLRAPVRVVLVDRQVPESLDKLAANQLLRNAAYPKIEVAEFEEGERQRFFCEVLKRSGIPSGVERITWVFEHRMRTRGLTAVEAMLPFLLESLMSDDGLALFVASRRFAQWKNGGVDGRALVLAAASTLLKGLPWEFADSLVGEKSSELVPQLERLTSQRAADHIPPLGTGAVDLGLALVILDDRPLPERRKLAALGWRVAPNALLENLRDCQVYKFGEEHYAFFISPPPEGATRVPEWALLISVLLRMRAGAGIDWNALAEPLLATLEPPGDELLILAGLLAAGEYLACRGRDLPGEVVWRYLEAAETAPAQWPDNETISTIALDLLKEGIRLVAKPGADPRTDRIAQRLNTATAVDLEQARAALAKSDSMATTMLEPRLLLRAETLAALATHFAARADRVNLLSALEELARLRDILSSRQVTQAYLTALTTACEPPLPAMEGQELLDLQAKRAEVSALLSQPKNKLENTRGFREWVSQETAGAWLAPQRRAP